MPKVSSRCNRRFFAIQPPPASAAFLAPPRKVSFEDGHQDTTTTTEIAASSKTATSSSPLSSRQVSLPVLKETCQDNVESSSERGDNDAGLHQSKKSSLVRPTTSQCLVDLAGLCPSDSDVQENKTSDVAPLSPVCAAGESTCETHHEKVSASSSSPPSSPWGHFVDLVIPHEEQIERFTNYYSQDPYYCMSRRRRRTGPYSSYETISSKRHLRNKNNPKRGFSAASQTELVKPDSITLTGFILDLPTPGNDTDSVRCALERMRVD